MVLSVKNCSSKVSRGLVLTTILGLSAGCDEHENKRDRNTPPGPVAKCENGLALGQSKDVLLYKAAQAPFGESCQALAFATTATCEASGIALAENGEVQCVETILTKLTVTAATKVLAIGDKTALALEGTDQFDKVFPVGTNIAKWTSSSPKVTISETGLVQALDEVTDAVITAEINGVKSEGLKISVKAPDAPRKSCGDTPDGTKKAFTRYAAPSVPFNATCEKISVDAICENGEFNFGNVTSHEACAPAKLTQLSVNPQVLTLNPSENAVVDITAIDDKDNKVKLEGEKVKWTYDASALAVDEATSTVTLKKDLAGAQSEVKLQLSDKTTSFVVQQKALEPTTLKFPKEAYLLKKGDKINLAVEGLRNGTALRLNAENLKITSSSPADVQVVDSQLEALTAGSKADIVAEYTLSSGTVLKAQAKVTIEAELTLTTEEPQAPAIITAETRDPVHAGNILVKGPAHGIPTVSSSDEACQFVLQYREAEQKKYYELLVELDVNSKAIPSFCEATITSKSAAGQTVEVKQGALVEYIGWTYTEVSEVGPVGSTFPVAKLTYKTSKDIALNKVELVPYEAKELKPDACTITYQEAPAGASDGTGTITVSAFLADNVEFCATRIRAHFVRLVADAGLPVRNITQPVTVSTKYKTFLAYCEEADASVQATISVVRRVTSLSSCSSMNKWLQDKNVNGSYFQLGLDRLNLDPEITNLAPLARLVYMDTLSLNRHSKLTDLSPLKHLTFLSRLKLISTGVMDFSPLYDRTGLSITFDAKIKSLECSKSSVKNASISKLCTQE